MKDAKSFGDWVTDNRSILAELYFDYFEHTIAKDIEASPSPLDTFLVQMYNNDKDLVKMAKSLKQAGSNYLLSEHDDKNPYERN